jgi:hypothetical protein
MPAKLQKSNSPKKDQKSKVQADESKAISKKIIKSDKKNLSTPKS